MANDLSSRVANVPNNLHSRSNLDSPSPSRSSSKSSSESPATPDDTQNDTQNSLVSPSLARPAKAPLKPAFTTITLKKRPRSLPIQNQNYAPKKAKQKRRGKIITELRERSAREPAASPEVTSLVVRSAVSAFNLAPSSTAAKIGSKEMADSLSWHLVNLTGAETSMGSRPSPLKDLRAAYENLAHMAMQTSSGRSKLDEVIFSVLAAIGARRSNHSAIVGLDACHVDECAPLDLVVKLQVGMRREQACRRLVDIAIEKLQSSGLMEDSSPEAYDALTMFRILMHGTSHDHDFAGEVIDALKIRVMNSTAHGDSIAHPHLRIQLIVFDTFNAILNGSHLRIKDEELFLYGWNYTDTRFSRRYEPVIDHEPHYQAIEPQFLSDVLSKSKPWRAGQTASIEPDRLKTLKHFSQVLLLFAVGIYREVSYLQIKDPLLQLPISVITAFFERLVGDFKRNMTMILDARVSQTVVLPHVMAVAHVVLSALVHEVLRRLKGRYDDKTQELSNNAQCFYLSWLHRFVTFIHDLPQEDVTLHSRALMMLKLDVLPGWVEIAVDGATQHSRGIGPLAKAGFCREDLEILHKYMKQTSVFFGSIGKREEELAAAFGSMDLSRGSSEGLLNARGDFMEAESTVKNILEDLMT